MRTDGAKGRAWERRGFLQYPHSPRQPPNPPNKEGGGTPEPGPEGEAGAPPKRGGGRSPPPSRSQGESTVVKAERTTATVRCWRPQRRGRTSSPIILPTYVSESANTNKRKLVLRDATSLEPKWQQTQDDGTVKAQWSLPPPVNKRKPEIQKQTKLDFRTSDLHNWTRDLARPPSQDRDWGRGGRNC